MTLNLAGEMGNSGSSNSGSSNSGTSNSETSTPREVFVWVLLAVVVLTPVVTAVSVGSLNVPFLDDWAYIRIAQDFSATGQIHFIDWNDINLVGLLPFTYAATWLFGDSIAALRVVGLLSYALFVWGVWSLCRLYLRPHRAAFATLVGLTFPTAGYLSGTLMSDLPAAASQIWCLTFGIRAMRCESKRRAHVLLAVALMVAFLGFTIRQQSLVAPLAVTVGMLWARERRRDPWVWVLLATVACLGGAFAVWRSTLPLGGSTAQIWPLFPGLGVSFMLALTFLSGAFLAPALWSHVSDIRWRHIWRRSLIGSLLISAVLYVILIDHSPRPFGGNGVSQEGALGAALIPGSRPIYLASIAWLALVALMVLGVGLALYIASYYTFRRKVLAQVRALDGESVATIVFIATSAMAIVAAAVTSGVAVDRYAAPLAVVIILSLLRQPIGVPKLRLGWIPLGFATFLAIVSLGCVWDAQAYAVARWDAGSWAVAQGYPATAIDAGFEWVGFHYQGQIQEDLAAPAPDGLPQNYYLRFFPRLQRDLVLLEEAPPGGRPTLMTFDYPRWFGLSTGHLHLVATGEG